MQTKNENIYTKMLDVIKSIRTVAKNGRNDHYEYDYAMERDLLEEVKPLLIKHGLLVRPTVLEQRREGTLATVKMEFTLIDTETDEQLKSIFYGEGQDKGDKATYKAYTGAVKYYLMKTFLIPTGDDPERAEEPESAERTLERNKAAGIAAINELKTKKNLSDKEFDAILEAESMKKKLEDLTITELKLFYRFLRGNKTEDLKETAKAHLIEQ